MVRVRTATPAAPSNDPSSLRLPAHSFGMADATHVGASSASTASPRRFQVRSGARWQKTQRLNGGPHLQIIGYLKVYSKCENTLFRWKYKQRNVAF
eukprot:755964-Hanusia_phi.AAC.3